VTEKQAREALRLASHKLPLKVRFVESERKFSQEEIAKFAEVQVLETPEELLTEAESEGAVSAEGDAAEGEARADE